MEYNPPRKKAKSLCGNYGKLLCVRDRAKWDLGRATSYVTSGTELKHSRDFWLSFRAIQKIWVISDSYFIETAEDFLRERTVSPRITIWSLASIWTTATYTYFFSISKCGLQAEITAL